MSVFRSTQIVASCGHEITVKYVHSLNIERVPKVRESIINREFQRYTCEACGQLHYFENKFLYCDPGRNTLYLVKNSGDQPSWQQESEELSLAPEKFAQIEIDTSDLRIVYGLEELREKLIIQNYGFNDKDIETIKVLILHEHPFLLQTPRLQLTFNILNEEKQVMSFIASHHHSNQVFTIDFPKSIFDSLANGKLEDWVNNSHTYSNLYQLESEKDYWISFARWSPRFHVLRDLQKFAQTAGSGQEIDVNSKEFKRMLDLLPRGNDLPGEAKQQLRVLQKYAVAKNLQELQDKLFEIRYGFMLEDDWHLNNDPDDIDTLWDLLRKLPDTDVEGNTAITEIKVDHVDGGYYDPTTGQIVIGSQLLHLKESFEDTVLHEVGHAVHEKNWQLITNWLHTRFGWKSYDTTNAGIENWVQDMGGWGGLTTSQISQVKDVVRKIVGPSDYGLSWDPRWKPDGLSSSHPWNTANLVARLAYENTQNISGSCDINYHDCWFANYSNWHGHHGKAFFINYYYQVLMSVDITTLDMVSRMPSDYAIMSPEEFFAELYTVFHDKDDPEREYLPRDVVDWLIQNLGDSV
ncbi:MAG: CpXC domain-containing protein [Reichenbachiella sp.]|uniref:CpXC domain-containing protein n=1 Tax=Reichenbachiella sp. TaxID=2184521 RepID=UPI0032969B9F